MKFKIGDIVVADQGKTEAYDDDDVTKYEVIKVSLDPSRTTFDIRRVDDGHVYTNIGPGVVRLYHKRPPPIKSFWD